MGDRNRAWVTAVGPPNVAQGRGGFALIEALIAMTIVVVALSASVAAMTENMRVREQNRETVLSQLAARQALENLKLIDFPDVFASFNGSAGDDPDGFGSAPGAGFAVPGLALQLGDPDGMVGRYEFPNDPADAPEILREDVVDANFGMPRDLTGEGDVDDLDHADDYRLLPVAAVIEWRSSSGQDRTVRLETYLTQR